MANRAQFSSSPSSSEEFNLAEQLADVQAKFELIESQYLPLKEFAMLSTAFANITPQMLSQDSVEKLLQLVANKIIELTCADSVYMHMARETDNYLSVVASCGDIEEHLMRDVPKRGGELSAQVWNQGRTQYTDNYNQAYKQTTTLSEQLKAVAVPITFDGNIFGVALFTSELDRELESIVPILAEVMSTIAMAVHVKAQNLSHRNELQRFKALSVLGDNLYQSTDWYGNLSNVSTHLFEIFDIDRALFYQQSSCDKNLTTHAAHEKIDNTIQSSGLIVESIPVDSIINWCFKNNQFAQINRYTDDPRESAKVHKWRKENNIGSTMCIPLGYNKKPWAVIVICKLDNKSDFNDSDADVFQTIASQVSTALQRDTLLTKVQHQAYHDSLTNLPNRRSFEKHFAEQINQNIDEHYSLLFCDLDGFKAINDSHGHDIGDELLRICAERMRDCIRRYDYLARMGGDEFTVLINNTNDHKIVDGIGRRLVKSLSQPFHVKDLRLHLGASIGISRYPEDGANYSELLNQADVAMYEAKNSGKGKVLFFNKIDAANIRYKSEVRAELLSALSENQFELWYQPQVHWASSTVTGVEALVRWNHPDRVISPSEFIPIAEESGFIDPLGMWILEEALSRLSSGALSTNPLLKISVNMAPPQFLDPNFSDKILSMLSKYNLEPDRLKSEITESFIMDDRETVVNQLKNLRENGVEIAIDDFGTGYSSLSYLQDLPLDVLNIDRSFVSVLTADNYEKSIAASIIALAKSLELDTIAEGVETNEQLAVIQRLGCEVIQGYYYSKPVPADELPAAIADIESYKN